MTKADNEGCFYLMMPITWEFLGVTIFGGLGGGLLALKMNIESMTALLFFAAGAIGALVLYRYIHVLAVRIVPLRIVTIILSGCVWTAALWYVLPRTQELPIFSLVVFVAACAWKGFNMKVRAE